MPPISIQPWTLRELFAAGKVEETIQQVADLGYSGIEGVIDGYDAASFRKWLDDRGMVSSSWFGPMPSLDNLDEGCQTLETLGTRWWTGGWWIPQVETVEEIEKNAAELAEVLPKLRERGFDFALHNHWMEFEDRSGKLGIERILEVVPDLKLELDIYWASNFGMHKPEEIATRYADRIPLLHVKDGPLIRDEPMLAVGRGKVDIAACIHAANPEWLIVELDAFEGDMMVAVADSIRFLVDNGLGRTRE
ncbi:sugar phosphate isomerase/epimerase [bacterium]|nr:MAG: sugar phosphate isomerase/epimerase [bacterium]